MAKRLVARVDNKQTKAAISGALFTFANSMEIGAFTSTCTRKMRGYSAVANSIAYFVGGTKRGGGGRLSDGMATHAAIWVSDAIRSGGTRNYSGPPLKRDYSTYYKNWLDKNPTYKGQPLLNLTGALADSITVIKGKGVGISKTSKSTNPMTGKVVKVYTYAKAHEFGLGNMPQRPIIAGAVLNWLQSVDGFETFSRSTENMLNRVHWEAVKNPASVDDIAGGSTSFKPSPMKGSATTTQAAVQVVTHNAVYVKQAVAELDKASAVLDKITNTVDTGSITPSQQLINNINKYFKETTTKLTPKQANAVITALLSGKVPDVGDLS